jgi:hypothetical protein
MKKEYQIILSISILNVLGIIGILFFINRLLGAIINFPGRIFLEHLLTGIVFPGEIIFGIYFFHNIRQLIKSKQFYFFPKKINYILLAISSFIIFSFEIWYQFIKIKNNGSFFQMLALLIGILILWIGIYKIKLFE